MASRYHWRPRRRSWQYYDHDAPTEPWLRRAVRGGGDGYHVSTDLREKLAFARKLREQQEQRRQAHAPNTRFRYNRHVRDYRQPRGPERIVPVTSERTYNIKVNEGNKKNGAAECENASQIESGQARRVTFGRNWNIAAVSGQGKTTERYRPLQMHHEHELDESNQKATRAQSSSSSEKQQTPRTDSPVEKRKHPSGCCQGNPKYAERNSGDGNDFYQLNIGKSSMASKTWNNDRTAKSYWLTPATGAPAPTAEKYETNDDPAPAIGPWPPKRPRLDTTVSGLKKEELKRQQDVAARQDKIDHIARWLQWGTGRPHAQEVSFFRHNGKCSPSPRRNTLASLCCNNLRWSSEEISAYAESDSSECKARRQKLQNFSAEKVPLRVGEMDDLLESFKMMCRST